MRAKEDLRIFKDAELSINYSVIRDESASHPARVIKVANLESDDYGIFPKVRLSLHSSDLSSSEAISLANWILGKFSK